jgi:hypothetical protein
MMFSNIVSEYEITYFPSIAVPVRKVFKDESSSSSEIESEGDEAENQRAKFLYFLEE